MARACRNGIGESGTIVECLRKSRVQNRARKLKEKLQCIAIDAAVKLSDGDCFSNRANSHAAVNPLE